MFSYSVDTEQDTDTEKQLHFAVFGAPQMKNWLKREQVVFLSNAEKISSIRMQDALF